MQRVIYEVYAKIVDANGVYSTLTGYPKSFDSRNYGNDTERTLRRARGEYHDTVGGMCKRDDRQLQTVLLLSASGQCIELWTDGMVADLPDPEPEPVPEPDPEPEPDV